jgi:hypothetical protein
MLEVPSRWTLTYVLFKYLSSLIPSTHSGHQPSLHSAIITRPAYFRMLSSAITVRAESMYFDPSHVIGEIEFAH